VSTTVEEVEEDMLMEVDGKVVLAPLSGSLSKSKENIIRREKEKENVTMG
jgi:hypothetical protein